MTTRTFSKSSLAKLAYFPPSKRGPGFRTISMASYSSSSSSEDSVEVPNDLNSKEILLFSGFDDEIADMIWRHWCNDEDQQDFVIEAGRHYIKAKATELNAIDEDDDWDAALQNMGISTEMRQRIMTPEFKDVRCTQSAAYWALDNLDETFNFLSDLSNKIDKLYNATTIDRVKSPDENKKPQPAMRSGRRQGRSGQSSSSGDHSTPITSSSSSPPNVIEGRTMMYKGGSEARLQNGIDEAQSLLIGRLYSTAPTDFHPSSNELLYFTKHHNVATKYARYQAERLPAVKAAVLQVAIPNSLISDAREIYGDDWRDLVWNSRNQRLHARGIRLPNHLRPFTSCDVLVSNLCTDATEKISTRMTDKSELKMSKLPNGEEVTQHVIQTLSRQTEIATQTVGFVWLVPYIPSGHGKEKK
ncbi:hypothetical protein CaCOL14_008510 [Colletotrichum acutatum]|uniref:Uncharacterized protein n=1 Tax=Glomerella acutata TaxID=27357 RepID=A0AAD8U9Z2_GLOAC|nr:uncharacterized protein BDZ83DRAFT_643109 [Colletotrichum acutatum]KAK1707141.1 hypothetical protein BDZ83DRAFT_643109 [Colletotrichum acutatum]